MATQSNISTPAINKAFDIYKVDALKASAKQALALTMCRLYANGDIGKAHLNALADREHETFVAALKRAGRPIPKSERKAKRHELLAPIRLGAFVGGVKALETIIATTTSIVYTSRTAQRIRAIALSHGDRLPNVAKVKSLTEGVVLQRKSGSARPNAGRAPHIIVESVVANLRKLKARVAPAERGFVVTALNSMVECERTMNVRRKAEAKAQADADAAAAIKAAKKTK